MANERQGREQQQQSPTESELAQVRYALRTYGGPYGQRLAEQMPLATATTQAPPAAREPDTDEGLQEDAR